MTGFSKAGIFFLLVIAAALTLPSFFSGVFIGHDLAFHLNWSRHFTDQLFGGEAYPRWLAEMNGGRGSPVFFYYAPIPYYFTSLLSPLVSFDDSGWLALGLSSALALGISGVGAFLWLSRTGLASEKVALVAAVFFQIMPYHLAVNLYIRVAFAEFWAMAWMPFILLAVREIAAGKKIAIVPGAIAYALLVMTHLPTVLIFTPVALLYGMISGPKMNRSRAFWHIAWAMFLGVGLASVYLLPALLTQDYVSFETMTENRFMFSNNFLFQMASQSGFRTFLLGTTILAGITGAAIYLACRGTTAWNREMNFWALIALMSIFMMLPLSFFVWESLSALQRIQFPWRFNTILCVALLPLLVSLLSSVQLLFRGPRFFARWLAGLLLLLQTGVVGVLVWEKGINTMADENWSRLQPYLENSQGVAEYFPRWVPRDEVLRVLRAESVPASGSVNIVAGKGQVVEKKVSARKSVLIVDAESVVEIELTRFFYPGWQARIAGGKALILGPTDDGYIRLTAPPGEHMVQLTLEAGTAERTGLVLSLFFTVLVTGIWARKMFGVNRRSMHQESH